MDKVNYINIIKKCTEVMGMFENCLNKGQILCMQKDYKTAEDILEKNYEECVKKYYDLSIKHCGVSPDYYNQ